MSSKRLRVLSLQLSRQRNASVSFYTYLQSLAWKTSELRWKACIEGVFDRASLYISANFHRVAPWTIVKFSIAEIGRIFFLPNSLGFAFQWFTVLLNNSCEASNYKFMSFILIFLALVSIQLTAGTTEMTSLTGPTLSIKLRESPSCSTIYCLPRQN